MPEESVQVCLCPLGGIIDTISKKWALLIINVLGNHGHLRFNELSSGLGGISPKTLTDTLLLLQAEGLLRREAFAEIPPRVEYSLTADGKELLAAIRPLLQWAAKTGELPGRSLFALVPERTGAPCREETGGEKGRRLTVFSPSSPF